MTQSDSRATVRPTSIPCIARQMRVVMTLVMVMPHRRMVIACVFCNVVTMVVGIRAADKMPMRVFNP